MGNFDRIKTELKQLPLILGKLIGGFTAVIGFTAAVIRTINHGWLLKDILLYLLTGLFGGIIFTLSAKSLKKRSSGHPAPARSALSWGLFILLAAIFLSAVYFFTS
jgi:hypothetical protein